MDKVGGQFSIVRTTRQLWGLSGMIIALFVVVSMVLIGYRYRTQRDVTEQRLLDRTKLYADNTQLVLSNIEGMMRATAHEVNTPTSDEELAAFVDATASMLPQLRTLLVINPEGVAIHDARPDKAAIGIDVHDRAYFIAQQTPNNTLFIDRPVQSRVDGGWSIPISLGVWADDGSLLGVVVSSIEPIYFSTVTSSAETDLKGYIINPEGRILTTIPYDEAAINQDVSQHAINVHEHPDTALMRSVGLDDAEPHLIGHRHLDEYGVTVAFTRSEAAINQQIIGEGVGILGVMGLLCLSVVLVLNSQHARAREVFTQAKAIQDETIRRLAAEHTVNQLEHEVQTVVQNTADFIVRTDCDCTILYANPAAQQMVGQTDLISEQGQDIFAEFETLIAGWQQVITTATPLDVDFSREWSASTHYYHARLLPEFNGKGAIRSVLTVIRDVTDLKRTQHQLQTNQRRLDMALDAARIGVYEWHATRPEFTYFNPGWSTLLGITLADFPDRDAFYAWLNERVHPEDSLHYPTPDQPRMEGTLRLCHADGHWLHVKAITEGLSFTPGGQPEHVLCSAVDISNRLKAEQARLQAEKLRIEAAKEREVADIKEKFIATVSHNFRTPLTIMRMAVYKLEQGDLPVEVYTGKLDQIKEQIRRMTKMLDEVLTISKAQSAETLFNPRPTDLRAFFEEMAGDLRSLAADDHQLEIVYKAADGPVMLDHNLMHQILSNLLSNAVKYTPPGQRITFEVANGSGGLVFTVADEGIGIPEQAQAHLFKPFYRAKNANSQQGTGLGLSIVQTYLDLHQRQITFESTEGQGATFCVSIPQPIDPPQGAG